MSTQTPYPSDAVAAPPAKGGFFDDLLGLWLSPREAYARILAAPNLWVPLIGLALLQGLFAWVWLGQVDIVEYSRAQAAAAGHELPPTPAPQSAYDFIKLAIGTSMFLLAPVVAFAMAGVLAFVYNFVLGDEVDYGRCVVVSGWATLATGLVTVPLTLLVLVLEHDWNIAPQNALATHLGAWLEPGSVGPGWLSLCQSLDLTSFWLLFLLAVGMSVAASRSQRSSTYALLALWTSYVLLKSAWAALF